LSRCLCAESARRFCWNGYPADSTRSSCFSLNLHMVTTDTTIIQLLISYTMSQQNMYHSCSQGSKKTDSRACHACAWIRMQCQMKAEERRRLSKVKVRAVKQALTKTRVEGEIQMDSIEGAAKQIISSAGGAVIDKLGEVGRRVMKSYGLSHDSPAVPRMDAGQLALSDLPKETLSTAFKTGDFTDKQSNVLGEKDSVDVCDLLARCKIPSRLKVINWKTTDVVGTDLLDKAMRDSGGLPPLNVAPYEPAKAAFIANRYFEFTNTAPSAVSNFYEKWRGSLKYTVEVLPTTFHQGQLYIAYVPCGSGIPTTTNFKQARNCVGATIDLSKNNRTELIIPWNCDREYASLEISGGSKPEPGKAIGSLQMFVQNPLTGPAAVTDNIDINLWISVEDDFEFISPTRSSFLVKVNGAWQAGSEEIVKDDRLGSEAVSRPSGDEPSTTDAVSRACNVQPANMTSIPQREYLMETGITWTASQARNVCIYRTSVATLLGQDELALTGLFKYHQWYRGVLELTLRMNANPFMTGMLAMFVIPPNFSSAGNTVAEAGTWFSENEPTINQMGCVFYTPMSNTTAVLRVPWNNFKRIVDTSSIRSGSKDLGEVCICVYNSLKVGTSGSVSLQGSLWGRIIDPYIGLKRAVPVSAAAISVEAELQGETGGVDLNGEMQGNAESGDNRASDTQLGVSSTSGRLAPEETKGQSSYMQNRHMNVKELLRRPDFIVRMIVGKSGDLNRYKVLAPAGGYGSGRTSTYLRTLYRYWSGQWRFTIANTADVLSKSLFTATRTNEKVVKNTTINEILDQRLYFNGTVVWKPYLESAVNVAVPFYSDWAMLESLSTGAINPATSVSGGLKIGVDGTLVTDNTGFFTYDIFQSIGDDFNLYYPMPFPPVRYDTVNPTSFESLGIVAEEGEELVTELQGGGNMEDKPIFEQMERNRKLFEAEERLAREQELTEEELRLHMLYFEVVSPEERERHDREILCRFHYARTGTKYWRYASSMLNKTLIRHRIRHEAVRDLLREGIEANPGPTSGLGNSSEDDLNCVSLEELDSIIEECLSSVEEQGLVTQVTGFIRRVIDWIEKKVTKAASFEIACRLEKYMTKIVNKVLPVVTWSLDFLGNLYVLMNAQSDVMKTVAMTSIAAKCVMAHAYGHDVLKQLTEVHGFRQALGADDVGKLAGSIATAVVAGALAMFGANFLKSDEKSVRSLATFKAGEAMATLSKINSGRKAVPELWAACKSAVHVAITYILLGRGISDDWWAENEKKVIAWQKQWDQDSLNGLYSNNKAFGYTAEGSNYVRIAKLAEFAKEVRAKSVSIKGFPVTAVRTASAILERFGQLEAAYTYANGRMEPIGIWLEGDPGCGKSLMATKILPFIVMKNVQLVKDYEECSRHVFSKPCDPDQKFMDGYLAQKWVMIDDFAAGTEDKDVLQIINLISIANCPVNMADIAEKKTLFTSLFVCATTNQRSVNVVNAVRDKSAIARRFPFCYHVTVAPTMATPEGRIDMEKLNDELEKCNGDMSKLLDVAERTWYVTKINLLDGQVERNGVSYRAMVHDICSKYLHKVNNSNRLEKVMATFQMGKENDDDDDDFDFGPGPDCDDVEERVPEMGSNASFWETIRKNKAVMKSIGSRPFDYIDRAEAREWENMAALADVGTHFVEWERVYVDAESGPSEPKKLTQEAKDWIFNVRANCENGDIEDFIARRLLRDVKNNLRVMGFGDWNELATRSFDCRSDVFSLTEDGFRNALGFCLRKQGGPMAEGKSWAGVIGHFLLKAGVAVAAYSVCYAIVRMITRIVDRMMDRKEIQGPEYDRGVREKFRIAGPKPNKIRVKGQWQNGVPELTDVHKSIQRALRWVQFRGDNSEPQGIYALAIDNRTLLMPEHFVLLMKRETDTNVFAEIEVVDKTGARRGFTPIKVDPANYEQLNDCLPFDGPRDLIVVKLVGTCVAHARSIRHLMITRKELARFKGRKFLCNFLHRDENRTGAAIIDLGDEITDHGVAAVRGVTATLTKRGDCGRPYVLANRGIKNPLAGLHIWGLISSGGVGVALISREAFEEAESRVNNRTGPIKAVEDLVIEEQGLVVTKADSAWWTSDMEVLGAATWNGSIVERHQPVDTAFVRSGLVHAEWTDEFLPSSKKVIKNGDHLVHPLYANAQKFCDNKQRVVPVRFHEDVVEFMKEKMGVLEKPFVLTEDEMINGVDEMQPVVLSTSCGFYQQDFVNGKKELFEEIEGLPEGEPKRYRFSKEWYERKLTGPNKTLDELTKENTVRIQNWQQPVTIWTATNKDELVKRMKARSGKTRVFVQPTVDISLLIRKYFGRFINEYKRRAGFNLCHGIGKDKERVWRAYWEGLNEVGDQGFDVDYSNYDGTVSQNAVDAFLAVTDHAYGYRNMSERHSLVESIVRSKLLVGRLLINKEQGNCSGSPITDIFNSITNWYIILMTYRMCAPDDDEGRPVPMHYFDSDVRAITYGDDVICSVSERARSFFNRWSVAQTAGVLGMVVTSAAKNAELVDMEPLSDLTFLKSAFVDRVSYMAAPLPIEVIHRELMWTRKENVGDVTILEQKVDAAMRFIAHHGKEAYDKLKNQLASIGIETRGSFADFERDMRDLQELEVVDGPKYIQHWPDMFMAFDVDQRENLNWCDPTVVGVDDEIDYL